MNNRQRALAILNYQNYDRLPIVHFGFLSATLEKWYEEGHLTKDEIDCAGEGHEIGKKLGFDFNWYTTYQDNSGFSSLFPSFERKVVEVLPNGMKKVQTQEGVIVLKKEGTHSISAEIDHILKDRSTWEEYYLPRLQYTEDGLDFSELQKLCDDSNRESPIGLYCKSLYGEIRDWLGIVGISYLTIDDEDLYDEIIGTVGNLCFKITERALSTGAKFDFAHFWEDICFKNGPLINPSLFNKKRCRNRTFEAPCSAWWVYTMSGSSVAS